MQVHPHLSPALMQAAKAVMAARSALSRKSSAVSIRTHQPVAVYPALQGPFSYPTSSTWGGYQAPAFSYSAASPLPPPPAMISSPWRLPSSYPSNVLAVPVGPSAAPTVSSQWYSWPSPSRRAFVAPTMVKSFPFLFASDLLAPRADQCCSPAVVPRTVSLGSTGQDEAGGCRSHPPKAHPTQLLCS
eukprot:759846-Hanusia_phi.AAC.6